MSLKKAIYYLILGLSFTACNSQSEIDSTFLSNLNPTPVPPAPIPVPFSSNFSFVTANSSQYTFDATKIDFNNGYAELTSTNQADNSNVAAGFSGGSTTGTIWSTATDGLSNKNYLRLKHASDGATASDLELNSSWTPAWSNVVAYWKMNGSGSISNGDSIVATVGSNATAEIGQGGTSQATPGTLSYVAGQLNQGIAMSADNNYLNAGNPPSLNFTGPFTLSAWVNVTAFNNYQGIFSKGYGCCGGYSLNIRADLSLWFEIDNGATRNSYNPTAIKLTTGVWQHVVAVYDGSMLHIYINGQEDGTGYTTTIAPGVVANDVFLGACFVWGTLDGTMDEVAMWNTGLSASAVSAIYQHQAAKYAGTFTSRVMDGLSSTSWTSLAWTPTLPFFKELPDTLAPTGTATPSPISESASNYSSLSPNLMTGLAGLWHFDEPKTATSALDASGNGNLGVPGGGVTFGNAGKFGNAATFNGISGSIEFENPILFGAGDFTISEWFQTTGITSETSFQVLWKSGQLSGQNGVVGIYLRDNEIWFWVTDQTLNNYGVFSGVTVNDGFWHNVVVERSGNNFNVLCRRSFSSE